MSVDNCEDAKSIDALHGRARRFILSYFGIKDDLPGEDGLFSCEIHLDSHRIRNSSYSSLESAEVLISSDELDKELLAAEKVQYSSSSMELFSEKKHYECYADIESPRPARRARRYMERKALDDGEVTYSIGISSLTYCLFCILKYLRGIDERPHPHSQSRYVFQMLGMRYRFDSPRFDSDIFSVCNGDWRVLLPYLVGLCSIGIDFSRRSNISTARDRATAFEFKYMYCNDEVIRRVTDADEFLYRRVLRTGVTHRRTLDSPPRKKYDKEAVDYYRLALSSEDPYVRFLSFYHVLERFFNLAYKRGVTQKLRDKLAAVDFSFDEDCLFEIVKMIEKEAGGKQQAGYGNEKNELVFLLQEYLDIPELLSGLASDEFDWKEYYRSVHVVFEPSAPLIDWDSADVIKLIANRIYKVRNAIIHSKQGGGGVYRPFLHESDLSKEIPLIRCLAERIIDGTGVLIAT